MRSKPEGIAQIDPLHLTPYDSLPDKRQVWVGAPGSREEGLGRLVLLTPEVVAAAAASCIRTGRRVTVGWELTKLEIANFNRLPCEHEIVDLLDGTAFDDIFTFNPQQSSQWDGLRHFSQPSPTDTEPQKRVFYGGVTKEEIRDPANHRIGMQYWAKEGICGRGVLLDYAAYAERKGISYTTFSDHTVPLSVLLEIAEEEKVTFQRGDILFVRVGVTQEWDTKMTPADKTAYAESTNPQHAGVEGTEDMLRWLWDTGFAAVAGDAISFEVYPPKKSHVQSDGQEVPGLFMHEYLLAGWGMPIGELFDLEGLSQLCRQHDRWEFFVASAPFNMPGGVSSPPNCIAIF
jgi:kynurenine formamidase